jgi:hypothetical protein
MTLQNPMSGFVEIEIDKERQFLDLPKDDPIYLKFSYNQIAIADRQLKKSGGASMMLLMTNPSTITTDDLRILLAEGLRHQFPGITANIAGDILEHEKFFKILPKVIEAASLIMEDWFEGDAAADVKNMRVRAIAVSGKETDSGERIDPKN